MQCTLHTCISLHEWSVLIVDRVLSLSTSTCRSFILIVGQIFAFIWSAGANRLEQCAQASCTYIYSSVVDFVFAGYTDEIRSRAAEYQDTNCEIHCEFRKENGHGQWVRHTMLYCRCLLSLSMSIFYSSHALLKKFGVYILFGLLLCKLCACRHIVISVSAQYVRVIVCVDQLITCIEHKYWLLHIGLLQKTKQHRTRSNSEHANRIRYM